jgi:hypothetical protein
MRCIPSNYRESSKYSDYSRNLHRQGEGEKVSLRRSILSVVLATITVSTVAVGVGQTAFASVPKHRSSSVAASSITFVNNYAGYEVTPASSTEVATATVTVPTITCTKSQNPDLIPTVWIQDAKASQNWVSAGTFFTCMNGKASYGAQAGIFWNATSCISHVLKVSPGDAVVLTASASPTQTSASVVDTTTGKSKSCHGGPGSKVVVWTGVCAAGPNLGGGMGKPPCMAGYIPKFSEIRFTKALDNSMPLGNWKPKEYETRSGTKLEMRVSPLTSGGSAFNVGFVHH